MRLHVLCPEFQQCAKLRTCSPHRDTCLDDRWHAVEEMTAGGGKSLEVRWEGLMDRTWTGGPWKSGMSNGFRKGTEKGQTACSNRRCEHWNYSRVQISAQLLTSCVILNRLPSMFLPIQWERSLLCGLVSVK